MLEPEEIERLQTALTSWSDEPQQHHLEDLFSAEWACEEHGLTNIQELHKVRFAAKIVHGERWVQGFKCEEV